MLRWKSNKAASVTRAAPAEGSRRNEFGRWGRALRAPAGLGFPLLGWELLRARKWQDLRQAWKGALDTV